MVVLQPPLGRRLACLGANRYDWTDDRRAQRRP